MPALLKSDMALSSKRVEEENPDMGTNLAKDPESGGETYNNRNKDMIIFGSHALSGATFTPYIKPKESENAQAHPQFDLPVRSISEDPEQILETKEDDSDHIYVPFCEDIGAVSQLTKSFIGKPCAKVEQRRAAYLRQKVTTWLHDVIGFAPDKVEGPVESLYKEFLEDFGDGLQDDLKKEMDEMLGERLEKKKSSEGPSEEWGRFLIVSEPTEDDIDEPISYGSEADPDPLMKGEYSSSDGEAKSHDDWSYLDDLPITYEAFMSRLKAEIKAMKKDQAKTPPGPKASSPVGPMMKSVLPLTGFQAAEKLWEKHHQGENEGPPVRTLLLAPKHKPHLASIAFFHNVYVRMWDGNKWVFR